MHHILPWQQQKWQYFVNRKNVGKLPHAILIQGIDGIGKSEFAQSLAELLLCQNNLANAEACGKCTSCQLLEANNHPDLTIIQSEEQGKIIKIDQIRAVIEELNNTSHQGGYRVVIIKSAELLNVAAANALLKTLEEPDQHTVIILISAHPTRLPATIRSRCQSLSMSVPKYFVAADWLAQQLLGANIKLMMALAENAPLKALDFARDDFLRERQEFFANLYDLEQGKISSVQMVSQSLSWSLENFLVTLMTIVGDLIKIKFTTIENIVNQDQMERFSNFARKTSLTKLFAFKDELTKLRQHLANKINLNQQLVMEDLMIDWMRLFEKDICAHF